VNDAADPQPRPEPQPRVALSVIAREWARTSALSLFVAVLAGLRALDGQPHRETGDVLAGLYFAALSLVFWARAAWIQSGRAARPTVRGYAAALAVGLTTGGVLVLADIVSAGQL